MEGAQAMLDEPRNERVAMVWPKSLKETVRKEAGPGGMTDFVIEAVVAHLLDQGIHIAANVEEEKVLSESPPTIIKKPIETHVREVWKKPVGPPEGKATNLTLEEAVEPPVDLRGRDDLFARVMAKAGNAEELAKSKDRFKIASELPPVAPEAPRSAWGSCPKCGESLVDGDCWTCD